ncbi:MAG: hypothetical protein D8M57_19640 [Candidatus Scalindua sp. AMX11]|nr:hypothetical protein [Planctomycetota bacterium]RZV61152.1 MAG: hypothetical protein EX341_18950 [Candidatus Scalindua sp. SCAELEC01]TDE63178.1 MAG: hypothetical protein D8M57_19640 [Candidatus Scalindua sp. AMX11]GJQ57568.1 MAG: hypothetical protein SCALA701_03690 [Candidatus Scalindua sp.]
MKKCTKKGQLTGGNCFSDLVQQTVTTHPVPLHEVLGEIKKETAFQKLTTHLNSEINALGYTKAAFFGYSLT